MHQQIAPTVTLDINSTVTGLELDGSGTTLVLTGNSPIDPAAAVNLTVTDLTTIGDGTTVNIGGGASLTLSGSSSNEGTINLSTTTIVVDEAPDIGKLGGSGTLKNSGTIQGVGTISIDISEYAAGSACRKPGTQRNHRHRRQLRRGPATLDQFHAQRRDTGRNSLHPSTHREFCDSARQLVVTVQNQVTNVGNLQLANAARRLTINGTARLRTVDTFLAAERFPRTLTIPAAISRPWRPRRRWSCREAFRETWRTRS